MIVVIAGAVCVVEVVSVVTVTVNVCWLIDVLIALCDESIMTATAVREYC